MKQPPLPEWYVRRREAVEPYFVPENRRDVALDEASPCGRFRLVVTKFQTRPGCWEYSLGELYHGDGKVAEVRRNFGHFPHAWVTHPRSGRTVLICGEDYQGQTIVDCETGERVVHIGGFCWARIHPHSADPSLLAVEGCVWACPYELRIYRLGEDGALALLAEADKADFGGWGEGQTLRVVRTITTQKSSGRAVESLSPEERAEHDARYERYASLPAEAWKGLPCEQEEDLSDEVEVEVVETWDVAARFGLFPRERSLG